MEKLTERSQSILSDIIDIYTETGQPVGSKVLAERSQLSLSSASLRNVMADLEASGFLRSPHTSAGRVPTEAAFRYYVDSVVEVEDGDLEAQLKDQLKSQLVPGQSFDVTMQKLSQSLSEMTNCTGLVMAPRHDNETLEKIEFVRLSAGKVLAIMVTDSGQVENRVIDVPDHVSEEDLNASATRLRDVVGGQTLGDARVSMMQALMEHKNRVDNMMDEMMSAAETWGEASVTDGALVVSGSQNLFQYPELVRDQLRNLVQAFEEKRMLMALMNEVQNGEGVKVFIGADSPLKVAKDVSFVTTTYGSENKKVLGTLGVIGPMRMNYRQTIKLVDYTGRLLSRALNQTESEK